MSVPGRIRRAVAQPLSDNDMRYLLPGVPLTQYATFASNPPLSSVVDAHGRGIVLFVKAQPDAEHIVGHWLAIVLRDEDGTALLFDPYGGRAEPWQLDHKFVKGGREELEELGEAQPLLDPYFEGQGYRTVYNTKRLQEMGKDVSTCGRHCACRLWRADLGDGAYREWLLALPSSPDVAVTTLTDQVLSCQE